jgi:hypothetical protein
VSARLHLSAHLTKQFEAFGKINAREQAERTQQVADDRYFLSPRIKTLRAIRAKLRPEPVREPLPPPKRYEPPRVTARQRGRYGPNSRLSNGQYRTVFAGFRLTAY